MWRTIVQGFLAGAALGPACFWTCGLFHAAVLARYGDRGRAAALRLASALILGRFAAYAMFGLLVGLLAGSAVWTPQPWVLFLAVGGLMMWYAVRPAPVHDRGACPGEAPSRLGRTWWHAVGVGVLTGISPCPPFLAAVLIALQAHGPLGGMLTLTAFFCGTSLWLIPVWFGPALIGERWRRRSARAARFVAAGLAAYALVLAWRGFSGCPLPARPGGGPHAAGPGGVHGPLAAAPREIVRSKASGSEKEAASMPPAEKGRPEPRSPGVRAGNGVPEPRPAPKDVKPLFVKPKPTRKITEKILRRLDLSLHEARYWEALGEGLVQCHLCPTQCILDVGEQGMCRARVNIGGKLRTIVYGRPVAVHVDPIEKKPLFHVLPGTRAFSIATVGCNLGCVFCQNYEISQANPLDVPHHLLPPEKVVELALRMHCDGIAYTYTEPTTFFEYMVDTARLARKNGLRNYWITCGWIQEKPLLELCEVLDAANVDLKGFSDEFYVKYCNAHLHPVLRTLEILRREQVHFEITNLVIPGANDDPEMIRAMCRWIVARLGRDTALHFSRFHPDYKLTRRPATPLKTLLMARRIALEEGLRFVYVGNVISPGLEDTICPGCGRTLIRRVGFTVLKDDVVDGRCKYCGARIPGIWRPLPRPEKTGDDGK